MVAPRTILVIAIFFCLAVAITADPFENMHEVSKRQSAQARQMVSALMGQLRQMAIQTSQAMQSIQVGAMGEIANLKRCQAKLAVATGNEDTCSSR